MQLRLPLQLQQEPQLRREPQLQRELRGLGREEHGRHSELQPLQLSPRQGPELRQRLPLYRCEQQVLVRCHYRQ